MGTPPLYIGVQVYLHLTWFMTKSKLNGTRSFFFPGIKGPVIIYRRWGRRRILGDIIGFLG